MIVFPSKSSRARFMFGVSWNAMALHDHATNFRNNPERSIVGNGVRQPRLKINTVVPLPTWIARGMYRETGSKMPSSWPSAR
jgi:hypothetical protein